MIIILKKTFLLNIINIFERQTLLKMSFTGQMILYRFLTENFAENVYLYANSADTSRCSNNKNSMEIIGNELMFFNYGLKFKI